VVALARGDRVVLENVAGEVVVETWDRDELQIRSADEGRSLAVRRTASRLELRPEDSKGRRREVEDRIPVPTWVDLAISGCSLEVDVNGLAGSLVITTVRGDVSVQNTTGVAATPISAQEVLSVSGRYRFGVRYGSGAVRPGCLARDRYGQRR
jgi:hypothetical protein